MTTEIALHTFEYHEELAIMYNWLQNQPYLPEIETLPMKHFLIACDGDVEKTKDLIMKQYELRNYYKELFIERDPLSSASMIYWDITDTFKLPGITPDGSKVIFMRLCDFDSSKYHFHESIKTTIMLYDALLSDPDPAGIPKDYICVCDMTGYSLSHTLRCNFNTLRIFTKFYQEGLSIKVKNTHVINCTDTISRVMSILSPLLHTKVKSMIKLHQPNTDTIFEYVPKEMFPKDYGGNAKTVAELKQEALDDFLNKSDYIKDTKYWLIDDSKRTEKKQGWFGNMVNGMW